MKRLLCVWFPNWPIQRIQAALPDSAQEKHAVQSRSAQTRATRSRVAVVVYTRESRRGPQVVACCEHAYARGVRVGMPLTEAKSLQLAAFALFKTVNERLDELCAIERGV